MEPDDRLPTPVEVEAAPPPQRVEAYLIVHERLLQQLGLGPA